MDQIPIKTSLLWRVSSFSRGSTFTTTRVISFKLGECREVSSNLQGNDQKNVTKLNQATRITWATWDLAQQQQEQICCLCFVLLMLNFVGQETGRDRTVSFVCLKPNNIEKFFSCYSLKCWNEILTESRSLSSKPKKTTNRVTREK